MNPSLNELELYQRVENKISIKYVLIPGFAYLWVRAIRGSCSIFLTGQTNNKNHIHVNKGFDYFYEQFKKLEDASPFEKRGYNQPTKEWYMAVMKDAENYINDQVGSKTLYNLEDDVLKRTSKAEISRAS